MATVLLDIKLFVPRAPRHPVGRPRLDTLLDRARTARLLLVSAPAGFGKTTLVAQWLARHDDELAAAWLSLDRSDNDPATFWAYVIGALRTALPGVGASELARLDVPQPPPVQAVLTSLLNDLADTEGDVVLVLDDYHVIESPGVHAGVAFLVEHLPPRLHLAITTRADPPLPVARLRARGELVEVRAADLRFTEPEVAAYLNGAMGLQLGADDVMALEGRTEGWIAALQLAALSMQGRDDPSGFIAGFTGDDRYVIDYLVEEVLQRQPEQVQTFLVQTSILNRLTGPLCDTVTGQPGGKATLEALDRGNLFLVPLDDHRRWYRYHHLFADVLRTRLLDEQPDRVSELHLRASRWHESHGDPVEAIGHALAGADQERAAALIELAMPAMRRNRQEAVLLGWLDSLPEEIVNVRPVLSFGYAAALLASGRIEGVESHLDVAEGLLARSDAAPPTETKSQDAVVVDQAAWRTLPSAIAQNRGGLARIRGDHAATVTHAKRALELAVEDDHVGRGGASALLGLVHWTRGDLEEAHRLYADALAHLDRAGHLSDTLGCALAMADMRIAQGRLNDAMTTYEQAVHRAGAQGLPALRGTADMHVGMSQLLLERNDLDRAREQLRIAGTLGEQAGLPQNPYRWRVATAALRQAEGDVDAALVLIDEAERVFTSDFSPEVRPLSAVRARTWLSQGRTHDALVWAEERGISADDALDYLREFEHITVARALLAAHRHAPSDQGLADATRLLERLAEAAETGGRGGSLIEVLMLLALARTLHGDVDAALVVLERALTLAEPERYARVFLDEGETMAELLRAAVDRGIVASYAARLFAATGERARVVAPAQGLVEPLSDRERDVLRLLATDLSGPEIADELVVSLNTVRTHTQRIYTKLGVGNRRLAVRRARELDLL